MADILIKGIQFPKFSPHVIEVYPDGTAIAQGKGIYGKAVPVPPHGRLIDADAVLAKENQHIEYLTDEWYVEVKTIENAPTIVEASEVE